ncbi:MAG: M4 family metallopeptidase [Fibrobacterales bacterium]
MKIFRQFHFSVLWYVVCIVLITMQTTWAVTPEEESTVPFLTNNPFEKGLKNLTEVTIDDLKSTGESIMARMVSLNGEIKGEVIERLNTQLADHFSIMEEISTKKDKRGNTHIRLQQRFKNIPVIGGDIIVHINSENKVYAVSGGVAKNLDLEVNLFKILMSANGPQVGSFSNETMHMESEELTVFDGVVAWQRTFSDTTTAVEGRWKVYVDAFTGEELFIENQIIHAAPSGGQTHTVQGTMLPDEAGQRVSIEGWIDVYTNYYLYNALNKWKITNDNTNDWEFNSSDDWGVSDPAAISLAKNIETIQEYVSTVMGLDSYDDNGTIIHCHVHTGTNYVNAYWNGSGLYFGDGNGTTANPLTVLDIAAHEYGHAITTYSSNLAYSYESGALNESFSDIIGALIEFYAQNDGRHEYPQSQGGDSDWLIGEDSWVSRAALRDMKSPTRFSQPQFYQGPYWYTGSGDNGGVHTNSGVQNYVFYLLAEGGTGVNNGTPYTVTGMGIEQAGEIAMHANMYNLSSNANYADSRDAWILAATSLGYSSVQVQAAWAAVGIGGVAQTSYLEALQDSIAFDTVAIGITDTIAITLRNSGTYATTVHSITSSNSHFSVVDQLPLTVPSQGDYSLKIAFTPTVFQQEYGELTIRSNADNNPEIVVNLGGEGMQPPKLVLSKSMVEAMVLSDEIYKDSLIITNDGIAPLQYQLDMINTHYAPSNSITQVYPDSWHRPTPKGGTDSVFGNPIAVSTGGPDAYGYLWEDSDANSGIPFTWQDISGSGVVLDTISTCDDCFQSVPLPFEFELYGDRFSTMHISSNGTVNFGVGLSSLGNVVLPSRYAPANLVAGLWDDLVPRISGTIYMEAFTDRVIVQYDSVRQIGTVNDYTFQMILFKNGSIKYNYLKVEGDAISATVGIQNGMKDDGLTVVYNAAYLHDSLSVLLYTGTHFLDISQESGVVQPGESDTIALTLNRAGMADGIYTVDLQLNHNDPDTVNPVIIPVTLIVESISVPKLEVSTNSIDFGEVPLGRSRFTEVVLRNPGNSDTQITDYQCTLSGVTNTLVTPLTIPAHSEYLMQVEYTPLMVDRSSGQLLLFSNAEGMDTLAIDIAVESYRAAELQLSHDEINRATLVGNTIVQQSTLINSGGVALNYTVSIKDVSIGDSVSWIDISLESGIIEPGLGQQLDVELSATQLDPGMYGALITIDYNGIDGITSDSIPVTFTVIDSAVTGSTHLHSVGPGHESVMNGTTYQVYGVSLGSAVNGIFSGNRYRAYVK